MKILWILNSDAAVPEQDCLRRSQDVTIENAYSGYEALGLLRHGDFDVILANFPLNGWEPHELLEDLLREDASVPVIVRLREGTFSDAVRLTKLGAFHFLGAAASDQELLYAVEAAVDYRRTRQLALFGAAIASEPWRKYLVGDSRAMHNVGQIIRMVGPRRCTVLITGETGTGKEMAARALHAASNRNAFPMVALNCSALPENLLEAELFGHVRGAFTGAIQNRIGRFEQANRSTLFLDEVGDMPIDLQAKLLRVLQEREFQRLGSSETIKIDVRVVAASNVDLVERIRCGRFREDLYYRLNVVPLHMPPLRERISDVRLLALHFVEKICRQEEIAAKTLSPETLDRLCRYCWPGNVRQLENAVEMAVAMSGDRQVLHPSDFALPPAGTRPAPADSSGPLVALPEDGLDFERTVGRIERQILEQALRKTGGNKKQAAQMLRLKRTTLSAKLRSLQAVAGQ